MKQTTYIINKYSKQAEFFRVDVDTFDEYKFCIEKGSWSIIRECFRITSEDVYSIYYRKPMLPDLSLYDTQYHLMIQRDIISVINGIVDSFSGCVLTKPSILRKTENKIYQLIYAGENGWDVPQSYIGNSSRDCIKYEQSASIIKPITTGKTHGKMDGNYIRQIYSRGLMKIIALTPVYLQNYISKQFEVRPYYCREGSIPNTN